MRESALSVRRALLLVALVSIVPALAVIVGSGIEQARSLEKSVEAEAHRYVESIVQVQAETSESLRRLLATLAGLRAFQEADVREELQILTDLLDDNPELVNITVTDADGIVTASAGLSPGTDLSGRRHVREALKSERFVAGEYVTALVGGIPSLPFAYPVRNAEGRIIGTVAAVYPLFEFAELFRRLRLPEETILGILDRRGTRLFFSPTKETNPVGAPIKSSMWHAVSSGPDIGTIIDSGSDDIERFYAYQRVYLPASRDAYLYVVLGYPVGHARGLAVAVLVRNLVVMLGVVLAAAAVALLLGGVVFGRRMHQLAGTARRISEGDLSARTGIAEDRTEIGQVAHAIDEMSSRLEERIRLEHAEQARIARSLREKEVLLKEIHHRVKNNLQLITSIVHLQRRTTTDLDDFCESLESRIRAITGVHEMLYEAPDLTTVRMNELLQGLTNVAAQAPDRPDISVDVSDLSLPIDVAIPLSLIASELITNAIKHARSADGKLRISVSLRRSGAGLRLTVADNGAGFPEGFGLGSETGLGMQLVAALARQLNATIAFGSNHGARLTLRIPAGAAISI